MYHMIDRSKSKTLKLIKTLVVPHLCGVDGEGEVLVLLEEGQLGALVDHARVDRVGHREVDQLAEKQFDCISRIF